MAIAQLRFPDVQSGFIPSLPENVQETSYVRDALAAVVELYEDLGKTLPINLQVSEGNSSVWLETLLVTA